MTYEHRPTLPHSKGSTEAEPPPDPHHRSRRRPRCRRRRCHPRHGQAALAIDRHHRQQRPSRQGPHHAQPAPHQAGRRHRQLGRRPRLRPGNPGRRQDRCQSPRRAIYSASNSRCSLGFSARNSAGATFVITAGHCTRVGGNWSGYNRVAIGTVATSDFPADDFGTIRVNNPSTWLPTSQVAGNYGTTARVLGAAPAGPGSQTCRSGSTTGYRCGTI